MANEVKEKKTTLEMRVRAAANGNGLEKLEMDEETKARHIEICKELVALADKHNGYPITYLVYFAVGKNAHRSNVFDKGYKKIDLQKANRIFMWLNQYAKHEGDPSVARDANVAHALTAYYERKTKNPVTFNNSLKICEQLEKKARNFKSVALQLGLEIAKNV